jgi:hypothetical protein
MWPTTGKRGEHASVESCCDMGRSASDPRDETPAEIGEAFEQVTNWDYRN